jgi:GNAT superfamily N-acetyltransferase
LRFWPSTDWTAGCGPQPLPMQSRTGESVKLPFDVPDASTRTVLRECGADEINKVEGLWRALYQHHRALGMLMPVTENGFESWAASMRPGLGRFTVIVLAEHDQQVGGFAAARVRSNPPWYGGKTSGWLTEILVDESLRGQGIGSWLLKAIVYWFESRGIERVEAQVITGNDRALEQYLRLGWRPETIQIAWESGQPAATECS